MVTMTFKPVRRFKSWLLHGLAGIVLPRPEYDARMNVAEMSYGCELVDVEPVAHPSAADLRAAG